MENSLSVNILVAENEISEAPVNEKINLLKKTLIVLIPLLLLEGTSLFQKKIVFKINHIYKLAEDNFTWITFVIYWSLHVAFIFLFIYFFVKIFPRATLPKTIKEKAIFAFPQKRDPLLIVRSLAFLMVFLGHWFLVVFPPSNLSKLVTSHSYIWSITASPWGGVWVFFTLSGYLMGKGFFSGRYEPTLQSIKHFYKNRALRILPLYLSAIIIVGIFNHREIFKIWIPSAASNLFSILLFDQQGGAPIGALWSVDTEVQFYLIVPFLCILMDYLFARVKNSYLFLLFIFIVIFSILIKHRLLINHGITVWMPYVYSALFSNSDIFLTGLLTAFVVERIKLTQFRITKGFNLGVILSVILFFALSYWSANAMVGSTELKGFWFLGAAPSLTAIVTASVIFLFELSKPTASSNHFFIKITWKIVTSLGLWTYALYVWHEPILLNLRKIFPTNLTLSESISCLFLGAPLVFLIGWFFYRRVELPFDNLRLNKFKK